MKKTNHAINQGKRHYVAPQAEAVILDSRAALLAGSVSGSGDYEDIVWDGPGTGEYGD